MRVLANFDALLADPVVYDPKDPFSLGAAKRHAQNLLDLTCNPTIIDPKKGATAQQKAELKKRMDEIKKININVILSEDAQKGPNGQYIEKDLVYKFSQPDPSKLNPYVYKVRDKIKGFKGEIWRDVTSSDLPTGASTELKQAMTDYDKLKKDDEELADQRVKLLEKIARLTTDPTLQDKARNKARYLMALKLVPKEAWNTLLDPNGRSYGRNERQAFHYLNELPHHVDPAHRGGGAIGEAFEKWQKQCETKKETPSFFWWLETQDENQFKESPYDSTTGFRKNYYWGKKSKNIKDTFDEIFYSNSSNVHLYWWIFFSILVLIMLLYLIKFEINK
jgi:hypothetical protein